MPRVLGRTYWRQSEDRLDEYLNFTTWNSLGLGKYDVEKRTKLDYCRLLGFDALCLTELWNHQAAESDFVVSARDKKDRAAGVGILLSDRLRRHVKETGSEGARIVWVRVRGPTCNLLIVGVYLAHSKRLATPQAGDTLEILQRFLNAQGRHECVIILGDLNAQLPRNVTGLTGRWTLSKQGDKGNAPLVMGFMRRNELVASNTYFQPPRGYSVAT